MIHQVFIIDESGAAIHVVTLGKKFVNEDEFQLYSGLISALLSFSEKIIGKPQTIDFKNMYLSIGVVRIHNKLIIICGIADCYDSKDAVELTIREISRKLRPIIERCYRSRISSN